MILYPASLVQADKNLQNQSDITEYPKIYTSFR